MVVVGKMIEVGSHTAPLFSWIGEPRTRAVDVVE